MATLPIITGDDLRTYLGAGTAITDVVLTQVATAASNMVAARLSTIVAADWPPEIIEAALAVGMEIYKARDAAGGQIILADGTVSASYRLSSALMQRVNALLVGYLDMGGMVG